MLAGPEVAWAADEMASWLSKDGEPEYVLLFVPATAYKRCWDRLGKQGWWELLSVAEYEAGDSAPEERAHEGYPDNYPLFLAAWAKTILGFPVTLEADQAQMQVQGWMPRWRTVPLYWVRRNT